MMIKPLGSHVLVDPAQKEQVTSFGIILPDTGEKDRPQRGTVVAVGPGKLLENGTREVIDVQVGQTVVFKKYAPDELEVKEGGQVKKYLVLPSSDIMAVLED